MWREDWAKSAIRDSSRATTIGLWVFSLIWNAIAVDYASQFDAIGAFEQRHRVEAARHEVRPATGVEITKLTGGGEQFQIHAKKMFGGVLRGLVFLAVWNAAIAAMIHFGAPWAFPAVFIVIDLLIIVSAFDYFFNRSTVEFDRNGVRLRKQWLGFSAKEESYAPAAIASIDSTTACPNSKSFGVTLKLHDGNTQLLGSNLPERESAVTVAAKMMADLGR